MAFSSLVTNLVLPASLIQIDELAFSYLNIAKGASLQIGDENNYKNWFRLDLDYYDQYDNI